MKAAQAAVTGQLAHRSTRISVALALAVMLIIIGSEKASGIVGSGKAHQYTCHTPCYGATYWLSKSEYFGAYTDISIVHFQCTSTCITNGGFIDNEIWLIDDSCHPMCWVEAGYMMDHNSPGEVFFWYDARHSSGPAWVLTGPVGPAPPTVPAGDYGHKDHFMIIKDTRPMPASPALYLIFMYNDSMGNPLGGTSSDNPPMIAGRILIGQELHGTGGATAEPATFTRNFFAVKSLNAKNVSFMS